jgi:hypothetical protein
VNWERLMQAGLVLAGEARSTPTAGQREGRLLGWATAVAGIILDSYPRLDDDEARDTILGLIFYPFVTGGVDLSTKEARNMAYVAARLWQGRHDRELFAAQVTNELNCLSALGRCRYANPPQ